MQQRAARAFPGDQPDLPARAAIEPEPAAAAAAAPKHRRQEEVEVEVEVEEVVVDTTAPPHHEPAHPGRSAREPLDEKLVRLVRCVRLRPRGPCAAPRRHQRSLLVLSGGRLVRSGGLPAPSPRPRRSLVSAAHTCPNGTARAYSMSSRCLFCTVAAGKAPSPNARCLRAPPPASRAANARPLISGSFRRTALWSGGPPSSTTQAGQLATTLHTCTVAFGGYASPVAPAQPRERMPCSCRGGLLW